MNFALRCVRIFPGVNSHAELVTLAPSLRPERRFMSLARGLIDFNRLKEFKTFSIARFYHFLNYFLVKSFEDLQNRFYPSPPGLPPPPPPSPHS